MSRFSSVKMVNWTPAEYHADKRASRSRLAVLAKSPAEYHARYIARTMPPSDESPAMRLGTVAHLAALTPGEYEQQLAPPEPIRPAGAYGRAKAGTPEKALYEQWKAELAAHEAELAAHPEWLVLTDDERTRVRGCVRGWRSHQTLAWLLDQPSDHVEQVILGTVGNTEVKVMIDKIVVSDDVVVVLDLKTTSDPVPRMFGAAAVRYHYVTQAAMYLDAVAPLYPDHEVHYALGVVRSSAPHEAACYSLASADIECGRQEYLRLIADLEYRTRADDWLASWQRGVVELELPRWAWTHTEDEEEIL